MRNSALDLIRIVCSPWSLGLKKMLIESDPLTRPSRLVIESGLGSGGAPLVAWLYWLLDGATPMTTVTGFSLRPRNGNRVARRVHQLAVRLDRCAVNQGGIRGVFEQLGRRVEIRVSRSGEGRLSLDDPLGPVPLIFPEGDGIYYRRLETEEQGESLILPDRLIDEALDFSDALTRGEP